MPNFLADVGRSNLGQTAIQGINGIAAIQGMQNQKQEAAIQAYRLKQLQEQEDRQNRQIDITAHPAFLGMPEEVRPDVLKFFSSSGFTNEKGIGKVGDVMAGLQTIEGSKDLFQQFMGPVVESKKKAFIDQYTALQDELAKGTDPKDKKIQTMKAQMNKARMDYESSSGNLFKHLEKLDEIEAAKKQPVAQELFVDPKDPAKFAYVNKNDPASVQAAQQAGLVPQGVEREGDVARQEVDDRGIIHFFDKKGNEIKAAKGGKTKTQASSGMQLTPEALSALSQRFGVTGEIPGMGMGRASTEARTKVLNQWASDMQKAGQTPQDQVAAQAAYKASRQELGSLQSQRGKVMAFAATAEKNLALAGKLSEKVGRTGVPVINRWVVAGKRSIAGDPDVASFDAALRTAINEYARVTSSATGGGVTSDQARKEVENILNSAQTPQQVKAVIATLHKEIGNRKAGYDEQIQFIKDSIAGKGSRGQTAGGGAGKDPLGIR